MSAPGLCWSCKGLKEIVTTDELGRGFCSICLQALPEPRELQLARWVAATCPYSVGDRVRCYLGGQVYDGIGTIEEVSTDPKDLATPLVPMFRVAMQEKEYDSVPDVTWYSEPCLTKVDA